MVGFGSERGRDLLLIAEETGFHLHSVIASVFLEGKVFNTLLEQAYENCTSEVRLCDDSSESWNVLLQWMYDSTTNPNSPMPSWDFDDALSVAPLVHKYDAPKILPGLKEALASKTPEARQLRSPEVAEMLAACHMQSVIDSWFSDPVWASYENIILFLKHDISDDVIMAALSAAWNRLKKDEFLDLQTATVNGVCHDHVSIMLNVIAGLLPKLTTESCEMGIKLLSDGCIRFARTKELGKAVSDAGFSQIIAAWFQDEDWWPMPVEFVDFFLQENYTENVTLAIIDRTTSEAKSLVAKDCRAIGRGGKKAKRLACSQAKSRLSADVKDLICKIVFHCNLLQNQGAVCKLVDSIPSSLYDAQLAERLAHYGFVSTALQCTKSMSLKDLEKLIDTTNHVELLRVASHRYCTELKLLQESLETKQRQILKLEGRAKGQERIIADLRRKQNFWSLKS